MATITSPNQGNQTRHVVHLTQADSPYTLDPNLCPCTIHNEGATNAVNVDLSGNFKGGEEIRAVVIAAQDIILDPGAGNRIIGSDGTAFADLADGKGVIGDAAGEIIQLECLGADSNGAIEWLVTSQQNANAAAGQFNQEEA